MLTFWRVVVVDAIKNISRFGKIWRDIFLLRLSHKAFPFPCNLLLPVSATELAQTRSRRRGTVAECIMRVVSLHVHCSTPHCHLGFAKLQYLRRPFPLRDWESPLFASSLIVFVPWLDLPRESRPPSAGSTSHQPVLICYQS